MILRLWQVKLLNLLIINKCLVELSVDQFESEIKVFNVSDSYFSNESDTKTIHSVAPDERLDILLVFEVNMLTLMLNLWRKNTGKTVTSHKV